MPDTPANADARSIEIADSAARRITQLVESENNTALMLRVTVSGGGCSGFQYAFTLDESRSDDDVVFESNGVRVIIDDLSLDLLQGSRLEYVDELIGSFFKLENPNAASTCGCGSSFAI